MLTTFIEQIESWKVDFWTEFNKDSSPLWLQATDIEDVDARSQKIVSDFFNSKKASTPSSTTFDARLTGTKFHFVTTISRVVAARFSER